MAEKPEPDAFLAGLDAKIAALQALRESYVNALSVGAFGSAVDLAALSQAAAPVVAQSAQSGPIELPTGVFRTKGLADAIRMYLDIAKRKQTTKEIGTALLGGGLASTSNNFEQTLKATLYRLRESGEVLQFKDGWDLASSYPESFRQRMAQGPDASSTRKRNGRKPPRKAGRSARKKAPERRTEGRPALRVA